MNDDDIYIFSVCRLKKWRHELKKKATWSRIVKDSAANTKKIKQWRIFAWKRMRVLSAGGNYSDYANFNSVPLLYSDVYPHQHLLLLSAPSFMGDIYNMGPTKQFQTLCNPLELL